MPPVLVRLALVAATAGALGVTAQAHAAPAPKSFSFTDDSGDALGLGSDDITKVTYTTTGKVAGKKYTPKNLVMTIELAEDATTDGTVQYNVEGVVGGCSFYVYVSPGSAVDDGTAGNACSEDDTADLAATYTTAGKKVTFTVPLGATPDFKAGAVITDLYAYTGSTDPVLGLGNTIGGSTPFDNDQAETDGTYKIG